MLVATALPLGCGDDATAPARDATYVAALNGANERPPRSSGASGSATFRVSGDRADYVVVATGLTGAPTVAHLLIGTREATAGQVIVRLELTAATGTVAGGAIDLGRPITFNNTTISGDSLRTLFDVGGTYVNVYTAAYPGGEIRGQVVRE
jgi:hypothetical protein